jgi:hypothetical protein
MPDAYRHGWMDTSAIWTLPEEEGSPKEGGNDPASRRS